MYQAAHRMRDACFECSVLLGGKGNTQGNRSELMGVRGELGVESLSPHLHGLLGLNTGSQAFAGSAFNTASSYMLKARWK